MKILVYGAGVLGCNLARNLLRAGKDVTLLARGNWAVEIKQNGLRIKDKLSPCTSVSRIPVVTELAPDAKYDVGGDTQCCHVVTNVGWLTGRVPTVISPSISVIGCGRIGKAKTCLKAILCRTVYHLNLF